MIDEGNKEIEPTRKSAKDNKNPTVTKSEYPKQSHFTKHNFEQTSTNMEYKTNNKDRKTKTNQPKVNFQDKFGA